MLRHLNDRSSQHLIYSVPIGIVYERASDCRHLQTCLVNDQLIDPRTRVAAGGYLIPDGELTRVILLETVLYQCITGHG